MRAIKIDSDRNPVLENGSIQWVYDADVVMQNCDQAMRQELGELNYAKDKGIEYFDNVYTGSPNFQRFEAQARTQLLSVLGVTGINSFEYDLVTSDNVTTLEYSVSISTIYGTITADDSYLEQITTQANNQATQALIASQRWVISGANYAIKFGV